MELEIVRRIRGNVHGTVDVTALEDRVIAHPFVQRLRRIRQLAFLSFVFPGATHSRFEHSLGVMQLAGITWTKMRANQKRLAASCGKYRDFEAEEKRGVAGLVHGLLAPTFPVIDQVFESQYTLQALRLAALLHDVGHPPFSHSGELFLPTWRELLLGLEKGVAPYLVEYLQGKCAKVAAAGKDPAKVRVRHEVYTLLLVDRLLSDVNDQGESPYLGMKIVPRDVLSIICPEIAPADGSVLHQHGIHKLLNELISGEVDIDRMDYLLRDSRECGVVYGIFDATRIQDSLCLYLDPADSSIHLAISFSGLAAFEDYLRARHSMYLQLYFHKTSVAAEAMMQQISRRLGGFVLPTEVEAYAELDEYNIEGALAAAATKLPSEKAKGEFKQLSRELLRDRRLWKRIFEVSAKSQDDRDRGQVATNAACKILEGLGVPYEKLSSSTSLTSFRSRGEHEQSRNYLRLIKKDERQFPRVVPIEDHSQLIDANDKVHITRIYVDDREAQARRLKELLTERLAPG